MPNAMHCTFDTGHFIRRTQLRELYFSARRFVFILVRGCASVAPALESERSGEETLRGGGYTLKYMAETSRRGKKA